MKEIYRNDAWEIVPCEKVFISNYERGYVKIFNRQTLNIEKSIRIPRDYYNCLCVDESEKIIILLCQAKNSIDVLDMDTLEKISSVKWKGLRTYKREVITFDKEEKVIYCILYSETKKKSLVTKLFLKDMEETLVWEKNGFFGYGFLYDKFSDDYIILGARFTYFQNDDDIASFEEGIWLNQNHKKISFIEANKHGGKYLQTAGFTNTGRIIYAVERGRAEIYYLDEKRPVVKNIERAAFSKSGDLYAYIKKKTLCVCRYEDNKCVQKINVEYTRGITYYFEFMEDDRYLGFHNGDEFILYQIKP